MLLNFVVVVNRIGKITWLFAQNSLNPIIGEPLFHFVLLKKPQAALCHLTEKTYMAVVPNPGPLPPIPECFRCLPM